MKKYIVWGAGIAIVLTLAIFSQLALDNYLEERMENLNDNITYTVPDEYLLLFNAQQISQLKPTSTTYQKSDYPVSILDYDGMYEVVIFKKKMNTSIKKLEELVKMNQPLKFSSINTKRYDVLEGFVNLRYAVDANKAPLDSVVITMPHEGKFTKELIIEDGLAFIFSNCKEFNLFYKKDKNPDISIELSNQLFGRKNTPIALVLKQTDNTVFFFFILPKNGDVKPIEKDFLKTLIK